MKKLVAAVTSRIQLEPNYFEIRNAVSQDLIKYLKKQNIEPLILPSDSELAISLASNADILIISGGNSLSLKPSLDNPEEKSYFNAMQEQNKTCLDLIRNFTDRSLPVFGICYGLQIINCYFGGSIGKVTSTKTHVNNFHDVVFSGDFKLFDNSKLSVNSFHNDSISDLGKGLEIFALSDDGEIEGIKNDANKIMGIMWHPERELPNNISKVVNETLVIDFMRRY